MGDISCLVWPVCGKPGRYLYPPGCIVVLANHALHTVLAGQLVSSQLYSPTAYLLCAATQQERVADLLFDSKSGLGLEIIRYNIGGSDTDATAVNSLRPGAAVPSLLLPDGTYDWSRVSSSINYKDCIKADSGG